MSRLAFANIIATRKRIIALTTGGLLAASVAGSAMTQAAAPGQVQRSACQRVSSANSNHYKHVVHLLQRENRGGNEFSDSQRQELDGLRKHYAQSQQSDLSACLKEPAPAEELRGDSKNVSDRPQQQSEKPATTPQPERYADKKAAQVDRAENKNPSFIIPKYPTPEQRDALVQAEEDAEKQALWEGAEQACLAAARQTNTLRHECGVKPATDGLGYQNDLMYRKYMADFQSSRDRQALIEAGKRQYEAAKRNNPSKVSVDQAISAQQS